MTEALSTILPANAKVVGLNKRQAVCSPFFVSRMLPLLGDVRDALDADHAFPVETHDRMVGLLDRSAMHPCSARRLLPEGKRLDRFGD